MCVPLDSWVSAIHRHPRRVLSAGLLLALLAWLYALSDFRYTADRTRLLREDTDVQRRVAEFREDFGDWVEGLVVLSGGTAKQREDAVNGLTGALNSQPQVFSDVLGSVELPDLSKGALFYLETARLHELRDELKSSQSLFALLRKGGTEALLKHPERLSRDPDSAAARVMKQLVESLETGGRHEYSSPFGEREVPEAFYFTKGGHHLLFFRSDDPGTAEQTIEQWLQNKTPAGVFGSLTGELILQHQDSSSTLKGALASALLSLVLVKLLFILGFGNARTPQLAVLSLLIGLSWAIGVGCSLVDEFNLITVNFVAILVGLGVDFGIHILYRYEEELDQENSPQQAMQKALRTAGKENLTGAVATAIAFFALTLTDFKAISELGWVSGAGVLLCYLAMVSMLPALVFLRPRKVPARRWTGLRRVESILWEYRALVLILALVATLLSLWAVPRVGFDYNLLNLQDQDAPAVTVERSGISSLSAMTAAEDLQTARALAQRFRELSTVEAVHCAADYLPERADQKRPLIAEILALAKQLPPVVEPRHRSGGELRRLGDAFSSAVSSGKAPAWLKDYSRRLENLGPGPLESGMEAFEKALAADLQELHDFFEDQDSGLELDLEQLPQSARKRWQGKSGQLLLRIEARESLWEREPLEAFVKQLQTIDPEVTGPALLIYHYLESLRQAYVAAGRSAVVVIAILLLLHFRSLKLAALALVPKVLGIIWMLGIMAWAQVDFNAANCMALPLTLGIGLVFGVHVVHRALEAPGEMLFSHCTGPAVMLSALTTVAGFGALMVAEHRGIASLGFVMAAGVGANLLAALVILPLLGRRPS